MTQTALDSYAMANGFGKTTQAMSEAEKVALRYQFVQEQLSTAQGDFARTSDGWANQMKILSLQFDSLKATIGQGLINIFTPVLKMVNTLIGKLSVLAGAFKSFTELITGKKSDGVGNVAADAQAAAAGFGDAADSAGNLADNTEGAGAAAKKAAKDMKALMGFDKINKLPQQDSSGSGSAAGAVDYGSLAEGETVVDELGEKFTKLFETVKNGIQPTLDALKRLWNEGLARLGTFTQDALKGFYDGFLVPVGKWVFGKGIPRFIDALNNGLMKVDFKKINDALDRLWEALTPFAVNIGEGLLWFWEKVLVPLGTWTANEVVPRFLDTLSVAIEALNAILEALKPLFKWFWDTVLQPLAEWTGGIFLAIWDGINEALKKFSDWCSEHQGIIETIAVVVGAFFAAWKIAGLIKFVGMAGGVITSVINIFSSLKSLSGALYLLKYGIGTVVSTLGGPFVLAIGAAIAAGILIWKNWDTIKAKAIEIWGAIKEWFNKTIESIKGFFTGLWKGIKDTFAIVGNWFTEKFTGAYDGVKNAFSKAGDFFKGVWKGITGAFGNITGWFKDKFSAAWEAVKNVFSKGGRIFEGIKDGILNGLKAVINGLIDGINSVVSVPFSGINWALDNLRNVSIAGIEPFTWLPTIDTPQIPRLAQGGFVEKNTPQLAVIGDNRHQGEVTAPEDKLREMAMEAVRAAGSGGITREELESIINNAVMRIVAALSQMGFYLDGEEMARAVKSAQDSLGRRYNNVSIR